MISRHITRKPSSGHYRSLALYIADAGHQGEKVLLTWCAGGWSEDDYELAIQEVEAVQKMNVRTAKEKTYHLLVSFRPEDEDKLTPDIFREIEVEFAQALGLAEHQRHIGIHRNTNNLHLHIGYNLIHPERRTRHEPFRDFWTRDKLCRKLELKYGLTPDKGRQPDKPAGGPDLARTYEAHTGQESFFSYARRQLADFGPALTRAKSWPEAHQVLARRGLKLHPRGNGLVVRDLSGHHSLKASDLDHGLSKARLEKRFGPLVIPPPDWLSNQRPEATYTATPLQAEPNRANLYDEYQAARTKRLAALEALKAQELRLYAIHRRQWDNKRAEIKKLAMLRPHRRQTMERLKKGERADLAGLRKQMEIKRDQIRSEYPGGSWSQFLQARAGRGQEEALAVLRSRKRIVGAERAAPGARPQAGLASVARLREILGGAAAGVKYRLDTKGTIIFSLPGGGTIREGGQAIHFTLGNEQARTVAGKLAQAKWGEEVSLGGNALRPNLGYEPGVNLEDRPKTGQDRGRGF